MKFNCGLTLEEKQNQRFQQKVIDHQFNTKWHRVYAWFPVRVGYKDCRWLEYVERQNICEWVTNRPDWIYRAIK